MTEPASSLVSRPVHRPVLDADRIGQLRTFLTVEAAADRTASASRRTPSLRRRAVVVGVAAGLALAGVLFSATAILDGPGPTRAPAATAVAITDHGGWTTIELTDVDADPKAVVEQLTAAGIRARVATAIIRDGYATMGDVADGGRVVGMVRPVRTDEIGKQGLVGLAVVLPIDLHVPMKTFPGPPTVTLPNGAYDLSAPRPTITSDGYFDDSVGEMAGVRFRADGGTVSISIRNGSKNSVVVYAS